MRKLCSLGLVLVLAVFATTACDPDGSAHTNNATVSATCTVQRLHRRVSTSPNRYEASTIDVHGAGSTCHADIASYGAQVSGVIGANTYWSDWESGHPAQAQITGVTSSPLSEHTYCLKRSGCVSGNA